jgi:hypothetical protein
MVATSSRASGTTTAYAYAAITSATLIRPKTRPVGYPTIA